MLEKTSKLPRNNEFAEKLRAYIVATLHLDVQLTRWSGAGVPTFLLHHYRFLAGEIGHLVCLFAIDQGSIDATPAEIAKHIARIERAFGGTVVYATQSLSADRRARLIATGVPFVIPGNQLYIPQLALDLREHFRARPKRSPKQLSPVAQAILFQHLLRRYDRDNTPSRLAKALYYSAMSVGRAFEELATLDLATVTKQGRAKKIEFTDEDRALIDAARPYLRKPARGKKYVRTGAKPVRMKQSGESALAALTTLSPPLLPVKAVRFNLWPTVAIANELKVVEYNDNADAVIELWYYDPKILSDTAIVDRLSLYAQFWDHPNERVASAAEDLLEQVPWL